jgi:hypothetical protein
MNDPILEFFRASLSSPFNQTDSLLFLRIPKNASSSIMEKLGTRNIVKKYEKKLQESLDKNIYKDFFSATHARPHELQSVISSIELDCFSFAVVRNPWDRVVSMYYFSIKKGLANLFGLDNDLSFEGFCEVLRSREGDRSFMPVFKQTEWTHGSIEVDEILKFENLSEDFSAMIKNHDIKDMPPRLPHHNRTIHKPYRDCFNSNTQKIIKKVFEEDCDRLKYVF